MSNKRTCQRCDNTFHGRSDKKFCSTECRTNQSNEHNRNRNNYMRNVNRIIRRNRSILEAYHANNIVHIHRSTLSDAGFNFSYGTHMARGCKKEKINFFYDFGLKKIKKKYFEIISWQEHLGSTMLIKEETKVVALPNLKASGRQNLRFNYNQSTRDDSFASVI